MAKDPSVLFYTSDFLTGTYMMTDEQVGQYIKLLCLQHQMGGYLTPETMKKVCNMDPDVTCKFKEGEDGRYYNERMLNEIQKRRKFTESRQKNLKGAKTKKDNKQSSNSNKHNTSTHMDPHMGSHMDPHMENENENENIKENKGVKGDARGTKGVMLINTVMAKLKDKKSPLGDMPEIRVLVTDYVDYRIRAWSKKPFTEKAAELFATSLIRLSRNNLQAASMIIERSIEMGWIGIFDLDEKEWRGILSPNQAPKSSNKSTAPEGYGIPSEKAVPMPESLKNKLKNIGNVSE